MRSVEGDEPSHGVTITDGVTASLFLLVPYVSYVLIYVYGEGLVTDSRGIERHRVRERERYK